MEFQDKLDESQHDKRDKSENIHLWVPKVEKLHNILIQYYSEKRLSVISSGF